MHLRDAIIGMSGISAYTVALFIESKLASIVIHKILNNYGIDTDIPESEIKENTPKKRGRPPKNKGDKNG